eukprot:scaffold1.g5457.t1
MEGEHHHHGLKKGLEAGAVGLGGYEMYEHHERKEERKREEELGREELGRERLEAGPPVAQEQGYTRPEGGYPPQAGAARNKTGEGGRGERYEGGYPQQGYPQQGYEGTPPSTVRCEDWKHDEFDCQWECNGEWELDCDCRGVDTCSLGSSVECELDPPGGGNLVHFSCTVGTNGQVDPATCGTNVAALNSTGCAGPLWRVTARLPPLPTEEELARAAARFLSLAGLIDLRAYLCGWFHVDDARAVRRDNFLRLAARELCERELEGLSPGHRTELERLAPGFDPALAPVTRAPAYRHKPLVGYLWVELLTGCACASLAWLGFRRRAACGGRFHYWLRPPGGRPPAAPPGGAGAGPTAACGGPPRGLPLVFLHGVGLGLVGYAGAPFELVRHFGDRPILIMEMRHISGLICHDVVTYDELAGACLEALAAHGFHAAAFLAHSYGTLTLSRLAQTAPRAVAAAAWVDPVCLLSCWPALIPGYLLNGRRPPLAALRAAAHNPLVLAVKATTSAFYLDWGIARTLGCGGWRGYQLWPEDLPARSLVALAERDDLMTARLAVQQLQRARHPAQVIFAEELPHAGLVVDPAWRARVFGALAELLSQADAELAEGEPAAQEAAEWLQRRPGGVAAR